MKFFSQKLLLVIVMRKERVNYCSNFGGNMSIILLFIYFVRSVHRWRFSVSEGSSH